MALIPTPGRVATAVAGLVRAMLRLTGLADRGGTTTAPGTNPVRRFSSAASRDLAGRAPAPPGGSSR